MSCPGRVAQRRHSAYDDIHRTPRPTCAQIGTRCGQFARLKNQCLQYGPQYSPKGRTCQPAVQRGQNRGGAVRSSFLDLAETAVAARLETVLVRADAADALLRSAVRRQSSGWPSRSRPQRTTPWPHGSERSLGNRSWQTTSPGSRTTNPSSKRSCAGASAAPTTPPPCSNS
jgi:hypothetical protein